MTYRWLKDLDVAARKSGLKVVTIHGWQTRGRPASTGQFNPKGVVAHHTGDNATGKGVAEGILKTGRSGLPGPLSQLGLDKDGTVYVIAAGRANHAGVARKIGFMAAGDGNAQAIGIEAFNSGSTGWSSTQIDAYYRLCAALCDHYGWSRNSVIGHGELSTSGKWDPGARSGVMLNMNTFRAKVKAVSLTGKPVPKTSLTDWSPSDFGPGKSGPQITMLDKRLIAHGFPGSETDPTLWSVDLQRRVSAFQRAQAWSGTGADGLPGDLTLARLTASPAVVTPPPPPVVVPPPAPVNGLYVVRPRDTAWSITRGAGITVEQLADWNDLVDPTMLAPGMVLKTTAPVSENPPVPPPTESPDLPEPPVTVPSQKKAKIRAACGNANVHWMGRWSSRVDNVANIFKRAGTDVALIAEMSTNAAGGLFVKEMGWGDADNQVDSHDSPRKTDSYDVHGGPHVGVKLFAGWNPDNQRVLKVENFWTTENPVQRNSGSMAVLLKDLDSGCLSVWVPLHLEFEPVGPNYKSHWGNKRRYEQADDAMATGKRLAKQWAQEFGVYRIPVFVGGDMNGDLDDPYDGPGLAAKKHSLVDSDKAAKKRVNVGGTHAKAGGLKSGLRIDRWFVESWVTVIEQETHAAYPHTDHNVVEILVEFDNNRP